MKTSSSNTKDNAAEVSMVLLQSIKPTRTFDRVEIYDIPAPTMIPVAGTAEADESLERSGDENTDWGNEDNDFPEELMCALLVHLSHMQVVGNNMSHRFKAEMTQDMDEQCHKILQSMENYPCHWARVADGFAAYFGSEGLIASQQIRKISNNFQLDPFSQEKEEGAEYESNCRGSVKLVANITNRFQSSAATEMFKRFTSFIPGGEDTIIESTTTNFKTKRWRSYAYEDNTLPDAHTDSESEKKSNQAYRTDPKNSSNNSTDASTSDYEKHREKDEVPRALLTHSGSMDSEDRWPQFTKQDLLSKVEAKGISFQADRKCCAEVLAVEDRQLHVGALEVEKERQRARKIEKSDRRRRQIEQDAKEEQLLQERERLFKARKKEHERKTKAMILPPDSATSMELDSVM